MRVGFVQNGDFRQAYFDYQKTGHETYHAQRHSMALVEKLAQTHPHVCVICISNPDPYHETLANGVHTIGEPLYRNGRKQPKALIAAIKAEALTHVVLRDPDPDLLAACLAMGLTVLPTYADTVQIPSGLRAPLQLLRNRRLARLLNAPGISYVGNHNVGACESLAQIGVARDKIIPWDWPRLHGPDDFAPKDAPKDGALKLLFVGTVSAAKGAAQILHALADPTVSQTTMTFVGPGEIAKMEALRDQLGLGARARFLGPVPFAQVLPQMRDHDALITFTQPRYEEGMPGVIYQGLAARLPVILSPHAAFLKYFTPDEDVIFAESFEPKALAHAISRLGRDAVLYEALSQNSGHAFNKLALDTDWVELVDRWLRNTADDHDWLNARRLDAVLARHPMRQATQQSS